MFEEAAGILGYRTKRRQAEQKLEAAQANLLRINDIVIEVEKQINVLRRQAAKARRYQRLVDDLRERRLALLRHRLAMADGERQATGSALEALRADEVSCAASLAADEAQLERLRLVLEEGEAAARRRRDEIHAFDLEIDRIQERLRAGQEQMRDLESRLAEGGQEMLGLRTRLSEQEGRLAAAGADIEAIEERLSARRSSTAAVAVDDGARATEIETREAALEAARAALLDRIERIAAITRRGASLEEQGRVACSVLDRIGRELEELGVLRERAASDVESLARESEAGQERARACAVEHEGAAEAARDATERLGAAEKRAEELKGRGAVLAERLAALAEMERQHAGFSEGVGDILKGASGLRPRGVVGDRLDVPGGLEKAVEATLGDLLEAVLVGGKEDAVRGVACGPVARILERTLLVEDLEQAFRLHAANPAFAYVTPQGDIVRLDGSATGGDGRALQHWLLQRRAEKEEITRRMADTAVALDEIEGSFVRLREDQTEVQQRLRVAALAVQDEARLAFERDLKLQQARAETDRIDRALPLLTSERSRLQRDIAAWGGEAAALAGDLSKLQDERRAVEEEIQTKGAELLALRTELDSVRRESAEARAVLAAAEERRQSLARERDRLGEVVGDLRLR